MKLSFWIALAFGLFAFSASAQIVQINPYYGYTLPMPLKTYYGKYLVDSGENFGGNLSIGQSISGGGFSQSAFFELQYNYHKGAATYQYYGGGFEDLGDLRVHNILAGGTKGGGNGTVEGYGGFYMGVTIFDVENPEAFDYTRFTMAFGAGLKYLVTPTVGIRLHTQLYLPMWGSSYYVGWGGGTYGTISTISSPYMNFVAGVYANIDRGY